VDSFVVRGVSGLHWHLSTYGIEEITISEVILVQGGAALQMSYNFPVYDTGLV
jgi:hypothetical protein